MPAATEQTLLDAGLRPTKQRVALAGLLFDDGQDKHFSAEQLFQEAKAAGLQLSLATVYNTLNSFNDAGLIRTISVDTNATYFDTNTSNHFHCFIEDSDELRDIDPASVKIEIDGMPADLEVLNIDLIIRAKSSR